MSATYIVTFTLIFLSLLNKSLGSVDPADGPVKKDLDVKKLEIYDGVTVTLPDVKKNVTSKNKLFSVEVDLKKDVEEGRGKSKKLLQRILPMFIMPFLLQSAIIPLFLSTLKFMLMKSMMVGKLALLLIIINAFKNSNGSHGRNDAQMADVVYGYHGNGMMEEYGAYIN